VKTALIIFKATLIICGAVIVLGAIGQSDYESIVLKTEITPFWQILLMTAMGLAFVLAGIFLPLPKKGGRRWEISTGSRRG